MTIATRRWKGRTASKATQATQQDRHSLTLEYDIFVNVRQLNADDTKNVQRIYIAEDPDFLTGQTLDLCALKEASPRRTTVPGADLTELTVPQKKMTK